MCYHSNKNSAELSHQSSHDKFILNFVEEIKKKLKRKKKSIVAAKRKRKRITESQAVIDQPLWVEASITPSVSDEAATTVHRSMLFQ